MYDFCFPEFFLASQSPNGFFSFFEKLYYPKKDWFCYILKGGPGVGKSTLMKKIAKEAKKQKISCELIHCSSDPKSLDAVVMPDIKKCIVDGTSPHVLDPIYPGATDKIINLGDCWNENKLKKSKHKIMELFEKNKTYHIKSQKSLSCFGNFFNNKISLIQKYIEYEKIKKSYEKVSKSFLKNVKPCQHPVETFRFFSAITPEGYISFENTANVLAKKIYLIEDKHNVVASEFIKHIRRVALGYGLNIISCPSPLYPEKLLEAIFIPQLEVALIANDNRKGTDLSKNLKTYKKINASRFLTLDALKEHKNIIKFYEKVCNEFLLDSIESLSSALKTHDKIEELYISAMNHSKIDKITNKLIKEIF